MRGAVPGADADAGAGSDAGSVVPWMLGMDGMQSGASGLGFTREPHGEGGSGIDWMRPGSL